MYILANRDIELSCDEAVVRLFGENTRTAYARSLISMEETRSGLTPLCNNFSKNAIEERITAIMKIKKASMFSLVLALALIVGVTTAFATSSASSDNDGYEISLDDADFRTVDVGDEIEGVKVIEHGGRYEDIAGLNITFGNVGDEIDGIKLIEGGTQSDAAGLVQAVGGQIYSEHKTMDISDLNRTDAKDIQENAQPMALTPVSVSHDDEHKFTPEQWSQILELINEGKVFWED